MFEKNSIDSKFIDYRSLDIENKETLLDIYSDRLNIYPELFTNIEAFKTIAKKYFEASVVDKDLLFDSETFKLPKHIGYSDDGIILLYNTYEIAPYTTGIIEFSVPFDEAKPYLVFNRF